jgi:death-on-curing protein
LDEDDVLCIRMRLAKTDMAGPDFGLAAPLNHGNFSSAVARQKAGFGRHLKYTSVHEIAATLFYGIALNHAFENGNKRTALVTMLTLLQKNKVVLIGTSEDELYDLATQVAAHQFPVTGVRSPDSEVAAIAAWLGKHTRSLQLGDRMMRFKEFKAQLEDLGCEFGKPDRNFIKIRRQTPTGELSARIGYPRADYEVPVNLIKEVRTNLQLDETHGVDSASFYELEATVDGFVNRYRHLLDRLAET